MMCMASRRRLSKQRSRPVRVHSNGTAKKRPIRAGFRVLARSRLETDPNGTFCANLFFEGGIDFENRIYPGQHPGAEYHQAGGSYAGAERG